MGIDDCDISWKADHVQKSFESMVKCATDCIGEIRPIFLMTVDMINAAFTNSAKCSDIV